MCLLCLSARSKKRAAFGRPFSWPRGGARAAGRSQAPPGGGRRPRSGRRSGASTSTCRWSSTTSARASVAAGRRLVHRARQNAVRARRRPAPRRVDRDVPCGTSSRCCAARCSRRGLAVLSIDNITRGARAADRGELGLRVEGLGPRPTRRACATSSTRRTATRSCRRWRRGRCPGPRRRAPERRPAGRR